MMLNKHEGTQEDYLNFNKHVGREKISKINKRAALLFGTIEQVKEQ